MREQKIIKQDLDHIRQLIDSKDIESFMTGMSFIISMKEYKDVKSSCKSMSCGHLSVYFDRFEYACDFIERKASMPTSQWVGWPYCADTLYRPAAYIVLDRLEAYLKM